MKKFFFACIFVALPVLYCWVSPTLIKKYYDSSMTYQRNPELIRCSISGIFFGLLLFCLIFLAIRHRSSATWGILIGFVVMVLMEINDYTLTIAFHKMYVNEDALHLLLGIYLGLFLFCGGKIFKKGFRLRNSRTGARLL